MNNNDIEEDIEIINKTLDILINNIRELPELTATAVVVNKESLLLMYKKILVDRERYKKLAEQNLKDSEEFKNNMCKHRCIKNNEILELQAKANKYDSLVERIKERIKFYDEKVKNIRENNIKYNNATKYDYLVVGQRDALQGILDILEEE